MKIATIAPRSVAARSAWRAVAMLMLAAHAVVAQAPAGAQAPGAAPVPAARPEDVASVEAIIAALYASISGDSAVPRDWDRLRPLFAPGARLMPIIARSGEAPRTIVWSVDEYIRAAGPGLERRGFHEREIGHTRETYGPLVQVFSAYDSKWRSTDPQPFARGINSIQLWHDGTRWWIQSILWWQETPATPIPDRYLRPGPR